MWELDEQLLQAVRKVNSCQYGKDNIACMSCAQLLVTPMYVTLSLHLLAAHAFIRL